MNDAHHGPEGIEYLTHDEHVKKHGERPQWLIDSHGSWKRNRKRQRRKCKCEVFSWTWSWHDNELHSTQHKTRRLKVK